MINKPQGGPVRELTTVGRFLAGRKFLGRLQYGLVRYVNEHSLGELHQPLCGKRSGNVVGDHHNGFSVLIELLKIRQNHLPRLRVEVSGRFVRQDQIGVVGQCAGQGDTLLLAGAQFAWFVIHPVRQTNALQ